MGRVKATKSTLQHVLASSIVATKPTINYAELTVLLSRVSSIINDRPLGVRSLSNEELVPVTPNILLLGRTGGTAQHHTEEETQEFIPRRAYQENLLQVWWSLWLRQVFPNLIPYNSLKESQRHENLREGDVCLLKFEGKIKADYRLCKVTKIKPRDDGLVRTVTVATRSRKKTEPTDVCRGPMYYLDIGVKRLILIMPKEEISDPTD